MYSQLLTAPLVLGSTAMFFVGGVVGLLLGAVGLFVALKLVGGKTLSDARHDADRIIADARREAETIVKQIELDGKNELMQKREEFDREVNATRNELKDIERRLTKREDNLDRKLDVLTGKERTLDETEARLKGLEVQLQTKQEELDHQLEAQREQLLRVANMSQEQAKQLLLERLESECRHEAGQIVQREMAKADDEVKDYARKITLQAIQRYAAEHTATATVTSVSIPSDDMKGRVIGREGRNIRAFEQTTGVDVIVDDTPGVVVVSCFDPVRRAIASEALSMLIEDGRIHPARIEEVVELKQREMEERLRKFGKDACIEANVQGLHPRIVEAVGRLHYRTSYGQNILRHAIEVAYLSQVIADELGLDGTIARRAGFLHDIGKALDHEAEGSHPNIGLEFVRKYGEKSEEVLNAVAGHHFDIDSTTPYTPIVAAADAISGARPGARRETLERYVKRLEELEHLAGSFEGVKQTFAIQAGREVRVIVDANRIDDAGTAKLAHDIAKRVEQEMTYPGEVRVTVLRELRKVEYAR